MFEEYRSGKRLFWRTKPFIYDYGQMSHEDFQYLMAEMESSKIGDGIPGSGGFRHIRVDIGIGKKTPKKTSKRRLQVPFWEIIFTVFAKHNLVLLVAKFKNEKLRLTTQEIIELSNAKKYLEKVVDNYFKREKS